jgi:hypothetical protein
MSHIAEVYAKDLGVRIGQPKITDHFYPNVMDKYIYFNPHGDYPSQEYKHWDVVFSMIEEALEEKEIGILTAPEQDKITVKQNNHLIKKSLLYVGTASHRVHLSDIFSIPSVCVLGNMYEENFNLFKYAEVVTPDFSKQKPSFQMEEGKNRVNEIKPETIAQIILAQLEIEFDVNFKTIRIGENFHNPTMEIVPNFFKPYEEVKGKPVNLRSDLHFDLEMITRWCRYCIVNLYLDNELEEHIVANLPNLKQIVFKYSEEHEKEDLAKFFKILKRYNKRIIIEVSNEEIVSQVRLKYFDYSVILKEEAPEVPNLPEDCKYISNKQFVLDGEFYLSESSAKRLDKTNNFVYDGISKSEIESLYLYVKK